MPTEYCLIRHNPVNAHYDEQEVKLSLRFHEIKAFCLVP